MKKIKLTQGKFALVDDEDFEYLNQWKWHLSSTGYARRALPVSKKVVYMHRVINKTTEGFLTDHINRNRLDNRHSNLRTCTYQQNRMNTSIRQDNSSGYTGVSKDSRSNKWRARAVISGREIYLGLYNSRKEANSAYIAITSGATA